MKISTALLTTGKIFDAWKVTRRTVVVCYGYLVWNTVEWFFALSAPTPEHAAAFGLVLGGATVVFAFYSKAQVDWNEFLPPDGRVTDD